MSGVIVYKGKYGATLQYAIWLGASLNLQVLKTEFANENSTKLVMADYVIIGSSVYIGKLQIASWLKRNTDLLKGKKLVFFVVAGTPPGQTEKLMSYFTASVPEELRRSCSIYFLPGRLQFRQLSFMDKLMLRMGAWLSKRRGEKIQVSDYDEVRKDNLGPVIKEVRSFSDTHTMA